MTLRHPRFRATVPGLLPLAAAACLLLHGECRPARAFVDAQLPTLADIVGGERGAATAIAVLKVEKVNREKKGIVYSKVRHLKGTRLGRNQGSEATSFTHVLRAAEPTSNRPLDAASQDRLNEAILDLVAEGKTAVVFQRYDLQLVCVGPAWYGLALNPVGEENRPQPAASDLRYARIFCGDVDELVTAVTDLLAGKEVTVPRMVGSNAMLNDRTAPIRRRRADKADPVGDRNDYLDPFRDQPPWATHRGNPQRTGADGPGPKEAKVLWAYKTEDQFLAPLVPGARDLYASSLGGFDTPGFHAFALDPAGDRQLRWSKGVPLLKHPVAGAPVLLGGKTELLAFGDGFHTDEGSALRCVRASDCLPLWQLSVGGKLVHFEGTPTVAGGKLFVGGGNAGVLCVDPARVTLDGKEQDLAAAQGELERRWKELQAKYEADRKKDPQFALPPDEGQLPRPTPKLLWQQGQDRWHVDAPVAVVEDRVLAASASLDDDKAGECALVCLKAGDGEVLWKTPLKLNPWAGPTVGPYLLVGCSSIRLDPRALERAKGEVAAVELDTGKVKWRKDVPGGVLSAVAVKAGLAVFTATDGKVRAWDALTGEERWAYDAGSPFFAGPAVTDKAVYAADLKGVVHALSLADGKKEWTLDLAADPATKPAGGTYGSPVVKGGRLYLAAADPGDTRSRAANVVVCLGDK
jgi:outer membrane protein assembly factor BamB